MLARQSPDTNSKSKKQHKFSNNRTDSFGYSQQQERQMMAQNYDKVTNDNQSHVIARADGKGRPIATSSSDCTRNCFSQALLVDLNDNQKVETTTANRLRANHRSGKTNTDNSASDSLKIVPETSPSPPPPPPVTTITSSCIDKLPILVRLNERVERNIKKSKDYQHSIRHSSSTLIHYHQLPTIDELDEYIVDPATDILDQHQQQQQQGCKSIANNQLYAVKFAHSFTSLSTLIKVILLLFLSFYLNYQLSRLIDQHHPEILDLHQQAKKNNRKFSLVAHALSFEHLGAEVPRVELTQGNIGIQQFNRSIKEILATLKDQKLLLTEQANNLVNPPPQSTQNQVNNSDFTITPNKNIITTGEDQRIFSRSALTPSANQSIEVSTTEATTKQDPTDNSTVSENLQDGSGSVCDDDDASCGSGISDDEPTEGKNFTDNEKLVNLQSSLQKQMKRHVKHFMSSFYDMGMGIPLSGRCTLSLMNFLSGLRELKSWAFKLVDASAKLPNGFMSGMLSDFGDFDQCLSIRTNSSIPPEYEEDSSEFSGKYCLITVKLNYSIVLADNQNAPDGIDENGILWDTLLRKLWTSKSNKGYQIGICLPTKCSNDDINIIYNYTTSGMDIVGGIVNCQDSLDVKRNQTADSLQKAIIYIFLALLVTVIIGTIINILCHTLYYKAPNEDWSLIISMARFFVAFSIIKNWKIFTCQDSKEATTSTNSLALRNSNISFRIHRNSLHEERNKTLSHLSGLKLLVIGWIMMGHSFLYPSANNYQYFRAMTQMDSIRDSIWFATTNFTLGIDTLLYIAGFLFVFNSMSFNNVNDDNGITTHIITIIKVISHKILRFWPTYLTVVGLAIICPLFGDGPLWPEMVNKRLGQACRDNSWSNLLFISNYQDEHEICLPSSWFISILMQALLVGSIAILIAQSFSTMKALTSLIVLIIGSMVASFSHAYSIDVDAPVVKMDESFVMNIDGDIFTLYTRLYNNLGPFLVGMVGGFILVHERGRLKILGDENKNKNIEKYWHIKIRIDWRKFCTTIFMAIIAIVVLSSVFPHNYSRLGSALYWSLHRIGWAIATGYLIHRCALGEWLLIKKLLSLSTFIPISKLIFVAYLLYPIFIHIHTGLVRDGLHISPYNMLNIYITRLVFTFGTALIIHLFIELPLCTLEENLLNSWLRKSERVDKGPSKFHPLLLVKPIFSRKDKKNVTQTTNSQVSPDESNVDCSSESYESRQQHETECKK